MLHRAGYIYAVKLRSPFEKKQGGAGRPWARTYEHMGAKLIYQDLETREDGIWQSLPFRQNPSAILLSLSRAGRCVSAVTSTKKNSGDSSDQVGGDDMAKA